MDISNNSVITNIVISGGSVAGLTFYGAIKQLSIQGSWDIQNIKTIYSASVGSILLLIIALKYDWEEMDEFLIKRPWHKVFRLDISSLLNAINNLGVFDVNVFHEAFDPLLLGKGLEPSTTLKEFYEYSNIECHIMCTKLDTMQLIDVSYKTHPDMNLITAIFCSCSVPIVFKPYYYIDSYYCDGGFTCNFPISYSLQNENAENTLAIGLDSQYSKYDKDDFNIFSYLFVLFFNLLKSINTQIYSDKVQKILFDPSIISIDNLYNSISEQESREQLIEIGVNKVKKEE